MSRLIDTNVELLETGSDECGVKYSQHIPDHFLQEIKDGFTGKNDPVGNFLWVGTVPSGVADRWLREGYDCRIEPIRKTLAKLKLEDLGKFVATSKRV